MSSNIRGKAFYECPAERIVEGNPDNPENVSWRPLVAGVVDAEGGAWAVAGQDSLTEPRWFVVVVNDRRSPDETRNPAVHDRVADSVSSALYLGPTLALAKASARGGRIPSAVVDRLNDQNPGGG